MDDRFETLHEDPAKPIGLTPVKALRLGKGRRAASTETRRGRAAGGAALRRFDSQQGALLSLLNPIRALRGELAAFRCSRIGPRRKIQISSILDVGATRERAGMSSESSLCDERPGRAGRGAG